MVIDVVRSAWWPAASTVLRGLMLGLFTRYYDNILLQHTKEVMVAGI